MATPRFRVLYLSLVFILVGVSACLQPPAPAGIAFFKSDLSPKVQALLYADIERVSQGKARAQFSRTPRTPETLYDFAYDIERANELAGRPDLAAVIGHDESRGSLLSAPIYNEARIPQLVPTSTSHKLKEVGQWTFMLAPDDQTEGAFISQFVTTELHAKSVTVFYHADEYGIGLRDGILPNLQATGTTIIDQLPFDWVREAGEAKAIAKLKEIVRASLRRGIPEVAIIAGRSREAGIIARLIFAAAPQVRFVAGDGVEVGTIFLKNAQQAAESFFLAAFWHPDFADEVSRAFVERFRLAIGRTPIAGEALLYDSAMVLAEAAREVGNDRTEIRQYLNDLGSRRPPYHGVTGLIAFGADRKTRMVMTQVKHGVSVVLTGE